MLISFMNDPASVFDVIKRYLEEGPDRFDSTTLRVYMYRHWATVDRIVVLVRLCRMARNMGLWTLHGMVHDILVDENRFITAPMLPMLATFIFANRSFYDQSLKDWCIAHIGHHFLELKDYQPWSNALQVCEDSLTTEWNKMLQQNEDIIFTLENHLGEDVLEKKIHRLSYREQDLAIAVLSDRRYKPQRNSGITETFAPDPVLMELQRTNEEQTSDPIQDVVRSLNDDHPWENTGPPYSGPSSAETKADTPSDGKSLTLTCEFRADNDSDRRSVDTDPYARMSSEFIGGTRNSFSRNNAAETAKARRFMGIDEADKCPPKRVLKKKKQKLVQMLGSPKLMSPRIGSPKKDGSPKKEKGHFEEIKGSMPTMTDGMERRVSGGEP